MNFNQISTREKVEDVVYVGNDRFEGYSIDLIDGISKILGFEYVFQLAPDNAIGAYDKRTGKWNGLVKLLLDRVSAVTRNIWRREYDSIDCEFSIVIGSKRTWPFAT